VSLNGRSPRAASLVCALLVSAVARPSFGEAPRCDGHDLEASRRAHADGLAHYRRATGRDIDAREMELALAAFDVQCAAGDETALELRAYALAGLRRFVDAAESLDAYLVAHPLTTLTPEAGARVAEQRAQILAQVATLSVACSVDGATVTLDGRAVGVTPITDQRLAEGEVSLRVEARGYEAETRIVRLAAGSSRSEPFVLRAIPPPPPPPPPPLRIVRPRIVAPVVAPPREVEPPREAPLASSSVSGAVIGSAVGAGVLALAGVGFTAWRIERTDAYERVCYDPRAVLCDAALAERDAAGALQITSFVAAGGLAALALILWRTGSNPSERTHATLCLPTTNGLGCVLAF
jgi:hypothetical protein